VLVNACCEHAQNLATRSTLVVTALRSLMITIRPQKIELRFCYVLHERGGSVVRSGPSVTGVSHRAESSANFGISNNVVSASPRW